MLYLYQVLGVDLPPCCLEPLLLNDDSVVSAARGRILAL